MYIWPVIGVINLLMTSRGPPSNGKSTMLTVISHGYISLPDGYFPANIPEIPNSLPTNTRIWINYIPKLHQPKRLDNKNTMICNPVPLLSNIHFNQKKHHPPLCYISDLWFNTSICPLSSSSSQRNSKHQPIKAPIAPNSRIRRE